MGVNIVKHLKTEAICISSVGFVFYWGLKLALVSVSIDKDGVAPNCVNNVRHIVVAF